VTLSYLTLVLDLYDGQGNTISSGVADFTPSVQLTDTADNQLIVQAPVPGVFRAGSFPQVKLLATDSSNVTPSGWAWTVSFAGVPGSPAGFSFFLPAGPFSFTATNASPCVFTAAGSSYASGAAVVLSGGSLPAGFTAGTTYYVVSASGTSFSLAATAGGAAINSTSSGSGTVQTSMLYLSSLSPVSTAVTQFPANPMTSAGDMIEGGSGGTPARLPIGTSGEVLTVAGGVPSWLAPAAPPWQFLPESYGGKGDGQLVSDAVMSSSSSPAHLACTTSNPFTSTAVDGGKIILVQGAGAAGADLVTTVSTVTDSGHAVLAASCSTTVNGAGAIFGTDNTTPIKSARAAMIAYAQASPAHEAALVLQPAIYCVGGAATVGGATLGNAIFPDPALLGSTPKLTLGLLCPGADAAALPHWLQPQPQLAGAVIAVLRLDGTNDGTYGPASVFGGPFQGYGGNESGSGLFTNICPVVSGVEVLVPYNSTFSGFDFWGYAEASVPDASCFSMGIVPSGGAWKQYSNGSITSQYTFGLRMPSAGNNDRCDVGHFSSEGLCYGFMPSEHTTAESIRSILCIIGIEGYSGNGVTMAHGARIKYASAESCTQALSGLDGNVKIDIDTLDCENVGNIIYDPNGHLQGSIGLRGDIGAGYTTSAYSSGTSSLAVRVVNLNNSPGPVASPQAPPLTTVAWPNYYYRDAEITLSVSGGTLSALKTDAVSESLPASCTLYKFTVPSGHAYTPTFTGTLTHTVKLL
jgi:hypothetical protein